MLHGRAASFALVLALVAMIASPARAELRIVVESDANCADPGVVESAIRDAVGSADAEIEVAISCGPPLVASVVVGSTARTLELSAEEVADLPAALALIASVTVETAAEPPPPPPPPPPPQAVDDERADRTPTVRQREAIDVMLRAGAWLGIAPSIAASLGLGVEFRFAPPFGIEIELSAAPPVDTAVAGGRVRVISFGGRIAACADGVPLEGLELGGCAGAWIGNVYGESDGVGPRRVGTLEPWLALDARVRATLVVGPFFLRAEVAFAGALLSPTFVLTLDDQRYEAARIGPLLGWAGLAVGVRLLP